MCYSILGHPIKYEFSHKPTVVVLILLNRLRRILKRLENPVGLSGLSIPSFCVVSTALSYLASPLLRDWASKFFVMRLYNVFVRCSVEFYNLWP